MYVNHDIYACNDKWLKHIYKYTVTHPKLYSFFLSIFKYLKSTMRVTQLWVTLQLFSIISSYL